MMTRKPYVKPTITHLGSIADEPSDMGDWGAYDIKQELIEALAIPPELLTMDRSKLSNTRTAQLDQFYNLLADRILSKMVREEGVGFKPGTEEIHSWITNEDGVLESLCGIVAPVVVIASEAGRLCEKCRLESIADTREDPCLQ